MEKTTIYLTSEQQAQLGAMAKRTGRPKAELIREAVTAYVVGIEQPWPKCFGGESDGEVNSTNLEDWLAESWKPDW